MSNICNMCGKEVRHVTAAGMCLDCSEAIKGGGRVMSSPQPPPEPPWSSPFDSAPAAPPVVLPAPKPTPAAPRGFRWAYYVPAVLLMILGAFLLSQAIFDTSTRAPISGGSGRGQALGKLLQSILGARGEEAFWSLLILALATGLGIYGTRGVRTGIKIVAMSVLFVPFLVIFGAYVAVAQGGWRETAWQRDVAKKISPLLDAGMESASRPLPAIHQKVVVWDYTTKAISLVQTMLPKERQGQSADSEVTFVLILATRDAKEKPYTDGTPAIRRTLVVGVVNWPSRQVLGVWPVEGEFPPFFTMRPAGEKGPVIGNTDEPLKRWITETIPKSK